MPHTNLESHSEKIRQTSVKKSLFFFKEEKPLSFDILYSLRNENIYPKSNLKKGSEIVDMNENYYITKLKFFKIQQNLKIKK